MNRCLFICNEHRCRIDNYLGRIHFFPVFQRKHLYTIARYSLTLIYNSMRNSHFCEQFMRCLTHIAISDQVNRLLKNTFCGFLQQKIQNPLRCQLHIFSADLLIFKIAFYLPLQTFQIIGLQPGNHLSLRTKPCKRLFHRKGNTWNTGISFGIDSTNRQNQHIPFRRPSFHFFQLSKLRTGKHFKSSTCQFAYDDLHSSVRNHNCCFFHSLHPLLDIHQDQSFSTDYLFVFARSSQYVQSFRPIVSDVNGVPSFFL